MARKPRIEYEGAFYHVITRGNQKQKIVKDPLDYRKFLEILIGYKQRYHFHLYAYILMSNHVHLLIETRDIPLSKILQGINQRYTCTLTEGTSVGPYKIHTLQAPASENRRKS